DHFRAILRAVEWATLALQRSHRFIAINRNHQRVPKRSRRLKVTHVPNMNEIETAIGKNKFATVLTHFVPQGARFFSTNDFFFFHRAQIEFHGFGAMKRNAPGKISKRAGAFPTSSPSALKNIAGREFTVSFAARRKTIA